MSPSNVRVRRRPRGYRVYVCVFLSANNGTLYLSRRLRLPFVPYHGLELFGLSAQPECGELVLDVAWDIRQRCFHIELLDCNCPDQTMAELIEHFGPGWRLHEPGTEPVTDA